jgi:hypothetical protein
LGERVEKGRGGRGGKGEKVRRKSETRKREKMAGRRCS